MIMPNMATMIAVITTDAPLAPEVLHNALVHSVNQSFNKVTVDSDTSTNDTCFLLASGKAAPGARIAEGSLATKNSRPRSMRSRRCSLVRWRVMGKVRPSSLP